MRVHSRGLWRRNTALMWAVFNGQTRQVEVLELLVAAGADLAAKNTDGCRRTVGRAQREHNPSASPDRWRQVDGTHVSREERPRGRRCHSHLCRCRHQRDEQRRVRVAHTTALRTRSRAENVVCHTTCDPSYSVRTTGPARSYTAEDVAGRFRKSAEYAEAVRKVRRASRLPAASDLAG